MSVSRTTTHVRPPPAGPITATPVAVRGGASQIFCATSEDVSANLVFTLTQRSTISVQIVWGTTGNLLPFETYQFRWHYDDVTPVVPLVTHETGILYTAITLDAGTHTLYAEQAIGDTPGASIIMIVVIVGDDTGDTCVDT